MRTLVPASRRASLPFIAVLVAAALASFPVPSAAQAAFDPAAINGPKWRFIGPFRAGRTKAAVGVPSQPNVFYIGMVNGGVWKTTDFGRTWQTTFDGQPSGSIGAVDVSVSNPNVVYVGSGEGLHRPDLATGDGIYKSTDAGKTWSHVWINNDQQIPRIAIDPKNPDRVFVAVLGHPYGPNPDRGILRTTDGGKTWQKVLYKDEYTGGAEVVMDQSNPNIIYASLWAHQYGPWENASFSGPGSGLFKSTDGGNNWKQLTKGLPGESDGVARIDIAIAPSNPNRLYIIVGAGGGRGGMYKTDDAGESWTVVTTNGNVTGAADDKAAIAVDPKNPEILYVSNTVAWKSTDGGKTWASHRGAPGGDDYQRYWINPNNPDIILLASDQGAVITVNGGESWSSWYNQPTAAFYHVAADYAWPYRLCSGQQDSGSGCVSSRGNDGTIGYREFHPVGVDEYDYAAPDPLDPDIVFGGKVTRYDRRTGQVQNVGPNGGGRGGRGGAAAGPDLFRAVRTAPLLFAPTNPHKLYLGMNVLWETVNGGHSWTQKSPDLSRETWEVPKIVGRYAGTPAAAPSRRGVIYTVAPSPVDSNTIWAGTDDGLIHVTRDNGKSWKDVTPPEVGPWAKVSIMDASHTDANEAYAAINTFHLDDLRPHIFRTKDGGKTWKEIVSGIADGADINVVREDTKRKGLLFAGSETQVWFSLDDGENWHSLRLNMPATSIRDLIVKDDDIAVGTHGRGFWILDDITALRQWNEKAANDAATLFKPQTATRVRYSMYTDTPVPPDEPYAENPPDGAIIDYYLKGDLSGVVTLEILGEKGRVIRKFSSSDPVRPVVDEGNWPWYWFRPTQVLSAKAGLQRFAWDLHFAPPPGAGCSLPISATPHNTKCEPEGPWVAPGQYTARLTAGGTSYTQTFTVRMDPRVKTPAAAQQQQYTLSLALYDAQVEAAAKAAQARAMRAQVADRKVKANALVVTLDALDKKLAELAGPEQGGGRGRGGGGGGRGGAGGPPAPESFGAIGGTLSGPFGIRQGADATPTTQAVTAANDRLKAFAELKAKWDAIVKTDLPAINTRLRAAGVEPISMTGN
ncbi:MAG: glycoside hydrolase [Gemmatimonadales bacterium]